MPRGGWSFGSHSIRPQDRLGSFAGTGAVFAHHRDGGHVSAFGSGLRRQYPHHAELHQLPPSLPGLHAHSHLSTTEHLPGTTVSRGSPYFLPSHACTSSGGRGGGAAGRPSKVAANPTHHKPAQHKQKPNASESEPARMPDAGLPCAA